MKTFLVIALSLILGLASAISVSAAPILFYLDELVDGTVDMNGTESDLSFTMVSGGTLFENKVKVGVEFGTGDIEGADVSLWSVKGGYRFVDAMATKIDGVVALLDIDGEISDLSSTLLGFDFTQYFSEKLFLSGSIAYSLDGSHELTAAPGMVIKEDDVPTTIYRVKLIYLINDNWGAALGYTDLRYEFDHPNPLVGKMDVSLGGLSLGAMYKF